MQVKNKAWFWFVVILALIALDQIIFIYLFKDSYFDWYLKNGSLITAVFALVTLTWDINKNTGLISPNPRHYAGSILQLIGAQYYAFGSIGKRKERKSPEGLETVTFLDDLAFIVFITLLIVINFLWLVLVAPIHYFFVLLLGGPARIYLSAPVKAFARFEGNHLSTREIPRDAETPKDWMDFSIANKPVTLTYGVITLALTVVKYFM